MGGGILKQSITVLNHEHSHFIKYLALLLCYEQDIIIYLLTNLCVCAGTRDMYVHDVTSSES